MHQETPPSKVASNDQLGQLPEPHLHAQALAVMNAGWERGGHVYSADQMRAYAAAAVAVERERCCRVVAVQRDDDLDARRTILAIRAGDDFHNVDDDVLRA